VSSALSPNLVEPLSYITDDDINSILNCCAVIVSVTIKLPVIVCDALNVLDPVVANIL
jgi:hypothetical protein